MGNETLFEERQRFKQWWIWIVLLGINIVLLVGVYKQVLNGQQFGDRPMSDEGLLFATGFFVLFTIVFFNFRLETLVKEDGIYVRFFPFHLSFRHFSWDQISKSFIRQYRPISEYGGWGLRLWLFRKGGAFNVSGNMGLQLEFPDNKKLLIGTNKPEELKEALNKLGQLKGNGVENSF